MSVDPIANEASQQAANVCKATGGLVLVTRPPLGAIASHPGMTKLELAALLIASGRPKGYTHRLSEWAKEIADEAAAILAAAEQHA